MSRPRQFDQDIKRWQKKQHTPVSLHRCVHCKGVTKQVWNDDLKRWQLWTKDGKQLHSCRQARQYGLAPGDEYPIQQEIK